MSNPIDIANANAAPIGSGIFLFCPGAESVSEIVANGGYQHHGSIEAWDLQPAAETVAVKISKGGQRLTGRNLVTGRTFAYGITHDELNEYVIRHMTGGGAPTQSTQAELSTDNADTLGFTANPATIGNWYQLSVSGAPVHALGTVTVAGKTEGTDFEVDYDNGMIRFLTAQSSDLTPVLTADQITTSSTTSRKQFTPFSESGVQGMACLYIFDQEDRETIWRHENFLTILQPTGNKTINQQQSGIQLIAEVSALVPGTLESKY